MPTEKNIAPPVILNLFVRPLMNAIPAGISITGRRAALVLKVLDSISGLDKGTAYASVGGADLELELSHPPERLLYYAGPNLIRSFQNTELYRLLKIVTSSGGQFIDIGANLGIYSLLARSLGLTTVCFEPEPRHSAFLKRNQRAYGKVFDCALSDANETAQFFVSGTNPGASSLVGGAGPAAAQTDYDHSVDILVKTFDGIVAEGGIDPSDIRLIKVDVEGNEARTIKGMASYLERPDSAPVWCEVRGPSSGRAPDSYADVTKVMATAGFEPYEMTGDRLRPFQPRDGLPTIFDLLFLHPRHDQFRALRR